MTASASHSSSSAPVNYAPDLDHGAITHQISAIPLRRKTERRFLMAMALSFSLLLLLLYTIGFLVFKGVGIWGVNQPVAWGFAIVNFVWWIGIGHAGTLISAILLLVKQDWRMSISRFAEAMTLFAVACAGLFPLLHMGRIWKFYYILPYPNVMDTWPQFRSPLVWDVFAITTYGTVSLLFWYTGLVPDLATMRDRARRKFAKIAYGIFALGPRGSARHWQRHQTAYILLAGIATPLVISVHSIVALDFATSVLPGWHTTVFPPYFVAGAVFSGFAMVLTLVIPIRKIYNLKTFITDRHLDVMAKVMLVSGLIVAYGYAMEIFMGFYGGHQFEVAMLHNRMAGPYAPAFWTMIACNVFIPQTLWFKKVRRSLVALFVIALVINTGMWLERYVIVVTSLHRDFLPSSWGMFFPTFWDWATYLGTFGLFFTLLLLFIRVLPMISMYEMRELAAHARGYGSDEVAAADHEIDDEDGVDDHVASDKAGTDLPVDTPKSDAASAQSNTSGKTPSNLFGLLIELKNEAQLLAAAKRVRDAGYERFDAFTPYPVPALPEAMAMKWNRVPLIVAGAALLGAALGYGLQYWSSAINYPINVGGRPLNSWPMFIPITFECAVLMAAFGAVFGMFALNRLPRPHHPLFAMPRFDRASQDRFFLCVETADAQFDHAKTKQLLQQCSDMEVTDVPH